MTLTEAEGTTGENKGLVGAARDPEGFIPGDISEQKAASEKTNKEQFVKALSAVRDQLIRFITMTAESISQDQHCFQKAAVYFAMLGSLIVSVQANGQEDIPQSQDQQNPSCEYTFAPPSQWHFEPPGQSCLGVVFDGGQADTNRFDGETGPSYTVVDGGAVKIKLEPGVGIYYGFVPDDGEEIVAIYGQSLTQLKRSFRGVRVEIPRDPEVVVIAQIEKINGAITAALQQGNTPMTIRRGDNRRQKFHVNPEEGLTCTQALDIVDTFRFDDDVPAWISQEPSLDPDASIESDDIISSLRDGAEGDEEDKEPEFLNTSADAAIIDNDPRNRANKRRGKKNNQSSPPDSMGGCTMQPLQYFSPKQDEIVELPGRHSKLIINRGRK